MAFQPLRPKDLSTLALKLEQLEEGSLVGVNLLRRSTMGLRAMMREILASVRFRGHVASESRTFTNSNGDLSLDALPALGKRYLMSDCLGFGSFSQVVRATDSWSGKQVCIKILRSDFGCFGWREAAIIRHLSTAIHSDQKYFVDLHDVLLFDGHVCLVLELMKATLFDLYGSFKIRSEPEPLATRSPQPPMQFVHPRPLRRGIFGNSQAEAKDSNFDANKDVMPRSGRLGSGVDGIGQRVEVSLALGGVDPPGPASRPVVVSISKISAEEVRTIRVLALSLVSALGVLRKEGVIHGDIKPENCFISWPRTSHAPQPPSSSSSSPSSTLGQGVVKSEVEKDQPQPQPHPTALPDVGAGLRLCAMPEDWRVRLGDFGCSFHSSEVAKHYDEFELQSLPYRSPEVLLGLPFDYAIDMWSLGVIVVELLTQKPLFEAGDKAALFRAMCTRLSAPPRRRFAAGKFSDEYFPHRPHTKPSPASASSSSRAGSVDSFGGGATARDLLRSPFGSVSSSTTNHSPDAELASDGSSVHFGSLVTSSSSSSTSGLGLTSEELPYSQHLENIRVLLIGCLEGLSSDVATHVITFVAGLLHPDPDCRLTPIEALKHPFLCTSIFAPLSLLTGGPAAEQGAARRKRGVAALGIAKLKGVHAQAGRAKMLRLDT